MLQKDIQKSENFQFNKKQLSSIMLLRCKGFFNIQTNINEKIDAFFIN